MLTDTFSYCFSYLLWNDPKTYDLKQWYIIFHISVGWLDSAVGSPCGGHIDICLAGAAPSNMGSYSPGPLSTCQSIIQ